MRSFVLERAASSVEAIGLGAAPESTDAHVRAPTQDLAGGTTLFDLMKLQVMIPSRLIDISALRAKHGRILPLERGLCLGALLRMSAAERDDTVRCDYPVLRDALWQAASPQLRNMASLGGNALQRTRCTYFRDTTYASCNKRDPGTGCAALDGCNRRLAVLCTSDACIAHYPGDFAIGLVALGAEVSVLSTDGRERTFAFEELHRLPGEAPNIETDLTPGDLITGFKVPAGAGTKRSRYVKVRDRAPTISRSPPPPSRSSSRTTRCVRSASAWAGSLPSRGACMRRRRRWSGVGSTKRARARRRKRRSPAPSGTARSPSRSNSDAAR